jgi:DNA polymerase
MRLFPVSELPIIDMTVRMFCEPQVKLDPHILATHLGEVRARKAETMAKVAHIEEDVFRSSAKFAELLKDRGVDVPYKISPATGEKIPALAKNDREFKELCSDVEQTEEVQALLAARVGSKSTLEETRTERMLALALKDWPDRRGTGWAPVPLRYYWAHTEGSRVSTSRTAEFRTREHDPQRHHRTPGLAHRASG